MNKNFITFLLLTTGIVAFVFILMNRNPVKEETHYHAGFKVFRSGIQTDYSKAEYMQISPCAAGEVEDKDEQIEKAHLHDGVGDVVHVHRPGAQWKDLFLNLKVSVEASATGYLNGTKTEDFLNKPISPYDSLIILIGDTPNTEQLLDSGVTRQYIESIEAKGESC